MLILHSPPPAVPPTHAHTRTICLQTPLNMFMKKYYYLLKTLGVWSSKARVGTNSTALFRSIEEQATQNMWWTGA